MDGSISKEVVSMPVDEPARLMQKAMFSGEFVDMITMKAFHVLEERLKDRPEETQLLNSMTMLFLYKSYIKENADGFVLWFNNQTAAEAIGEISHLTGWEVE